jgi:hypothetical protein
MASEFPEPRLVSPINYRSRMFSGSDLTGSSSRKVGDIQIANGDGFYDEMIRDYIWEGRSVEVYVGSQSMDIEDFEKIMVAKIKDITWNDDILNVKIHDDKKQFTENIQPDKYQGTGGAEGTSEMSGVYKPQLYGYCFNVTPVLIDAPNLVYQVHDGAIASVVVKFAGLEVVEAVGYTVDLDTGLITLLTNPQGMVTCDVQGAVGSAGYARTTADLVRRITEDHSDLVWPGDYNSRSFDILNKSNTHEVGVYVQEGNLSIKSMLDSLMEGINGYWFFDRLDKLTIGMLGVSGSIPAYDSNTISKVSRDVTSPPIWSVDVYYRRNNTVMSDSDIAGAVTGEARIRLQIEGRTTTASDTGTKDDHTDVEQAIYTDLRLLAGAEYQAARRLNLFGMVRDSYKIELPFIGYSFQIGDGIVLQRARFGLDGGQVFMVTAIQENAATGVTNLELWG